MVLDSQFLKTPVEFLKGVGPQRADVLKKELSIFNYWDLLRHYPFRYIDRTKFYKLNEVDAEMLFIQIIVRLKSFGVLGEKSSKRLVAQAVDDTGNIELVWFQSIKWIEKSLQVNTLYVLFGKVSFFNGKMQMTHPELEIYQNNHFNYS